MWVTLHFASFSSTQSPLKIAYLTQNPILTWTQTQTQTQAQIGYKPSQKLSGIGKTELGPSYAELWPNSVTQNRNPS